MSQLCTLGHATCGSVQLLVLKPCARAAQTLTFTIKALPSEQSSVKFGGGAVAAAVADASQGLGSQLITAISPGAQLTSVALFIDQNQQSLAKPAATEWGWGGWWALALLTSAVPGWRWVAIIWQLAGKFLQSVCTEMLDSCNWMPPVTPCGYPSESDLCCCCRRFDNSQGWGGW